MQYELLKSISWLSKKVDYLKEIQHSLPAEIKAGALPGNIK